MNSSERWPLDFDAIAKGDTFTPERLEAMTGHKRGGDAYRFAVLDLRERIMTELAARKRPATVAFVRGCLCVLTDEQASVYTARQCRLKLRGHLRNVRRMRDVCIEKLSAEQRKAHERSLCVETMIASAARKTRKKLNLESHQRSTPVPSLEG
jgi:hypothetical protein